MQLIEWLDCVYEALGSTAEAWQQVLSAAAEEWDLWVPDVVRIYEDKQKWQAQCAEQGVTTHGLAKEQAHLPSYLRKSRRCKGVVMRAKGGGRKDNLEFLYPLVTDFFETMRLYGKYVDAVDLVDNLVEVMRRYVSEAEKPGVQEYLKPEQIVRLDYEE